MVGPELLLKKTITELFMKIDLQHGRVGHIWDLRPPRIDLKLKYNLNKTSVGGQIVTGVDKP